MPRDRPKHEPMTAWYDPRRLLSIGIHVAEATIFGHMFDRRELMAALDPFDRAYFDANFDFSRKLSDANGDFWLDFAADTGDGWQSTYAVARLLARQTLNVEGCTQALPQGRVLVFGGDQVYPTASEKDYQAKLKAPFDAANAFENAGQPATVYDPVRKCLRDRHLFAVPGNHDWYDDLTSFSAMFCNKAPDRPGGVRSPGRTVCGRQTAQTRSYFALKLPHNWWLCAFDAQLEGYIDAPQLRFFEYVAQNLMDDGSNVILSVAGPVWAYSRSEAADGFKNFGFASLIATGAIGYPGYTPTRHHNLRLVLTGDAHHYAHFVERAPHGGALTHYLTCGLGGAFLHPTHWLEDTSPRMEWPAPPPVHPYDPATRLHDHVRTFQIFKDIDGKEQIYPDRARSRCMTWRNLLFVWFNPWFGVFLAGIGIFATWLLHFGAQALNTSLSAEIGRGGALARLRNLGRLLIDTPWPLLIVLGIGAALYYFADFRDVKRRLATGIAHAAAHVIVYAIVLLILANCVRRDWIIVILTGLATGAISPSIMGGYLLVMLNVFGVHWDEAYSSLRIADFKGFLRLRFTKSGDLEVYPIVMDAVPTSDTAELAPRLLEGPISIPGTAGAASAALAR